MTATDLRDAIRAAVADALKTVGLAGLRATSMFPSSQTAASKKAA